MASTKPLEKSLADLTCADFVPGLGQVWTLVLPELSIPLTLESAKEQEKSHGDFPRTPFSLIFHTEEMRYPPQGSYVIRHDDLGEVEAFIVPLGPLMGRPEVFRYQICFN